MATPQLSGNCPKYLAGEVTLPSITPVVCTNACDCPGNGKFVGIPGYETDFEDVINFQPLGSIDIFVAGTVNINSDFKFNTGSNICMLEGAQLIVRNESIVQATGTHVRGCDFMWRTISVEAGSTLHFHGKGAPNIVEDGEFALQAALGSTFGANSTTFRDNHIGIYSPGKFSAPSAPPFVNSLGVTGNLFYTTGGSFLPPYSGAVGTIDFGLAGVYMHNTQGLNVGSLSGALNTFSGLRNGVFARESILRVHNSHFFNIQNPNNPTSPDYNGIRLESVINSIISHCYFDVCNRGIRARASNLVDVRSNSMEYVNVGIFMTSMSDKKIRIRENNEMQCRSLGIVLENSPGILSLEVWENVIRLEELGINAGSIEISNSTALASSITDNTIHLKHGAKRAVNLTNAPRLNFTGNEIYMNSNADGFAVSMSDGVSLETVLKPIHHNSN